MILHQEDFFIQKIRIVFTVLEMLEVYGHSFKKICERYESFFKKITISKQDESNFIDMMTKLWRTDSDKSLKNKFVGIARIVDYIINVKCKEKNNRDIIANFAFELRNRNFHGNMSPALKMNSISQALLELLYSISLKGIYEKLEFIIRDSKK